MSGSDNDNDQLGLEAAAKGEAAEKKNAESDPRDEIHVNTADEVIALNSVRLFSITELPLDRLPNCRVLELRKNLIHQLVPLPQYLRDQLEELDLFDNKVKHIAPYFSDAGHALFEDQRWKSAYPAVTDCHFAKLRKLDLSYNQIKRITGLEALGGTLEELYLVENHIKVIENLGALGKLRLLELGGNQIRAVDCSSLRGLASLEQLWVGKNKIATLEAGCFAHCPRLRRISLQANRLTSVPSGVFAPGQLQELRELYLSENGLKRIENIAALRALTLVDYSFNPIPSLLLPAPAVVVGEATTTSAAAAAAPAAEASSSSNGESAAAAPAEPAKKEGEEAPATPATPSTAAAPAAATAAAQLSRTELTVENFPQLEEFWLTDGALDDWKELAIFAPFKATLTTIYLERNPLEKDRRYRDKVYQQLPFLAQIDSWPIVNKQNPELDRAIHRR